MLTRISCPRKAIPLRPKPILSYATEAPATHANLALRDSLLHPKSNRRPEDQATPLRPKPILRFDPGQFCATRRRRNGGRRGEGTRSSMTMHSAARRARGPQGRGRSLPHSVSLSHSAPARYSGSLLRLAAPARCSGLLLRLAVSASCSGSLLLLAAPARCSGSLFARAAAVARARKGCQSTRPTVRSAQLHSKRECVRERERDKKKETERETANREYLEYRNKRESPRRRPQCRMRRRRPA